MSWRRPSTTARTTGTVDLSLANRLLLDSNVVWWWATSPGTLSQEARAAISASGTWLAVSVATVWELEIKQATGKLDLTDEFWPTVRSFADSVLAITEDDAVAAARLPLHHRDPFDRMIVAQAGRRGLTVATRDTLFRDYAVPVLWS